MNPSPTKPGPPPTRPVRRPHRPRLPAAVAAVAATAALAGGCASPAAAAAPAPPIPAPATAELTAQDLDTWLDGLVPTALEQAGIPGATISVVHDGEMLTARGYGHADTGADGGAPVPVDPEETLFRPGSVSKLFTATAVMQLVEEGEVDLDTDVHEYLDFTVPTSFEEPLTLRHLLSHTPGFEERIGGLIRFDDAEPDLRERLATDPPEQIYEPGTVPAYSNYGSALAGYIVEHVSGVPFEQYVQEEVLDPLDMDSSTFAQPLPEHLANRLAGGYAEGTAYAGPFETVTEAPAGALTSSATDMARFMLAHLDELDAEQALLRPETLELMHAPGLGEDSLGALAAGPRMTLGFFEEDRNGHRILGHGGDTTLFHSHMQIHPDQGAGIFVGLNGGGHDQLSSLRLREAIMNGFADRYFPASGETDSPVQPTAAEHAAIAEGTYEGSRAMHSTFLNIIGVLGGQTRITAQEDGTILVAPAPLSAEPAVYEEIEPWVWREVGGQRLLAMRVQEDRIEAIGYDSAFALLPIASPREASLALPVLAASVLVLFAAALSWPIGAVARRRLGLPRRDRAGRTARILTRAGVGTALAALAGWAAVLGLVMEFQFVGEEVIYALLAMQWLGVAAIAPAAVVLFDDIRLGSGWKRCLGSAFVLLALAGVAGFAAVFGLLSFNVSY